MAGRGGPTPGAGRKKGGKNRATIERELRVASGVQSAVDGGYLPLDVILARMRASPLPDGTNPTDSQYHAAVDAAPYLHARLASTDTTIKSDNTHRVLSEKPMTEEDWVAEHATPANDAASPPFSEDEDSESAA
jgi:hypothetical protein